jgi:hypothetical protein
LYAARTSACRRSSLAAEGSADLPVGLMAIN